MKLLILAASTMLATAAGAVTVTSPLPGPDQGPLAGQNYVVDFETATPNLSGGTIYTASVGGVAAAPFGDTTSFLGVNGSATLTVSGVSTKFNSFSLYWGSIDAANTLEVFDLSNTLIKTVLGSDISIANGDQSAGATNRRVFFTLAPGETLGSIRFSNPGAAFELDDVAFGTAIPEPAVWGLMIVGFGLVGLSTRGRRNAAKVVTA